MTTGRVTARLTCRIAIASFVACLALTPVVSAQEPPTLAVAPFTNIAAEPSRDWIGVGIAETVSTDLRAANGIDVLSRAIVEGAVVNLGGADPGKPTECVLIEVVRELGADYLLAGAFQQLGEQLRLTARLIDVQSETAVEAFKVDGRRDDLFELQDRLAGEVRAAVRRMLGRSGGARIAAVDAETREETVAATATPHTARATAMAPGHPRETGATVRTANWKRWRREARQASHRRRPRWAAAALPAASCC